MELKNNTKGSLQFFYNSTGKGNIPELEFVHIPSGATVELDDDIYRALRKPLTTVREQRRVVSELEGEAEVNVERKPIHIIDFEETGAVSVVNLFSEMVKKGDIIIVAAPETPLEYKKEVLAKAGISLEKASEEQIVELYNKLVK